jgi:hypothetical protein
MLLRWRSLPSRRTCIGVVELVFAAVGFVFWILLAIGGRGSLRQAYVRLGPRKVEARGRAVVRSAFGDESPGEGRFADDCNA